MVGHFFILRTVGFEDTTVSLLLQSLMFLLFTLMFHVGTTQDSKSLVLFAGVSIVSPQISSSLLTLNIVSALNHISASKSGPHH